MVNNFRQSASGCRVISFNRKKNCFLYHTMKIKGLNECHSFCLYWKMWDEKKITICWIRNTSKIDRSTLKSVTQCRAKHCKKSPDSLTQYKTEPKLNFTSELYEKKFPFFGIKKGRNHSRARFWYFITFHIHCIFNNFLLVFFFCSLSVDAGWGITGCMCILSGRIWVDTHAVNWFDED